MISQQQKTTMTAEEKELLSLLLTGARYLNGASQIDYFLDIIRNKNLIGNTAESSITLKEFAKKLYSLSICTDCDLCCLVRKKIAEAFNLPSEEELDDIEFKKSLGLK